MVLCPKCVSNILTLRCLSIFLHFFAFISYLSNRDNIFAKELLIPFICSLYIFRPILIIVFETLIHLLVLRVFLDYCI